MKRLRSWLVVAALSGLIAVLGPALATAGPEGAWSAVVENPSVYTFHGLMVAGFILGLLAPVKWMDLPVMALAMIGLFPLRALLLYATGRAVVAWPRESLLYAAWLMPAIGGLGLGLAMRNMQKQLRDRRERAEKRKRKR